MGTMCATVVGILIEVVCLNWNELVSDYLQSRYCLKLLELVCRRTVGGAAALTVAPAAGAEARTLNTKLQQKV